jgi:hypothetical protein
MNYRFPCQLLGIMMFNYIDNLFRSVKPKKVLLLTTSVEVSLSKPDQGSTYQYE